MDGVPHIERERETRRKERKKEGWRERKRGRERRMENEIEEQKLSFYGNLRFAADNPVNFLCLLRLSDQCVCVSLCVCVSV